MATDVRWVQRLNNYLQAFNELRDGVMLSKTRPLSKLEKQGIIQGFEYTHELAWNLLKDYLAEKGYNNLIGSKDTTRQAFKSGLVSDGEMWMEMIKSRNLTSHSYDEAVAEDILESILNKYYPLFASLADKFTALNEQEQ